MVGERGLGHRKISHSDKRIDGNLFLLMGDCNTGNFMSDLNQAVCELDSINFGRINALTVKGGEEILEIGFILFIWEKGWIFSIRALHSIRGYSDSDSKELETDNLRK
jgi:hypothetical protein